MRLDNKQDDPVSSCVFDKEEGALAQTDSLRDSSV